LSQNIAFRAPSACYQRLSAERPAELRGYLRGTTRKIVFAMTSIYGAKLQTETIIAISKKISPEKAACIAESLGVEFSEEQFRINTQFATGEKITHVAMGLDRIESISIYKLYPSS
jgi:hypothetical protein